MFKIVGNPEIESLLNNNKEEVGKQVYEMWIDAVVNGGIICGLESFCDGGMLEYRYVEINGEDIEFEELDFEVDEEELFNAAYQWS